MCKPLSVWILLTLLILSGCQMLMPNDPDYKTDYLEAWLNIEPLNQIARHNKIDVRSFRIAVKHYVPKAQGWLTRQGKRQDSQLKSYEALYSVLSHYRAAANALELNQDYELAKIHLQAALDWSRKAKNSFNDEFNQSLQEQATMYAETALEHRKTAQKHTQISH